MGKGIGYTMIVCGVVLLCYAGFAFVGYDVRLIVVIVVMAVVAMAVIVDLLATWGIWK